MSERSIVEALALLHVRLADMDGRRAGTKRAREAFAELCRLLPWFGPADIAAQRSQEARRSKTHG